MRLAWYAGASTALAGAVVASAFHQRANFYSAMVHLSQSNISIMIVVNVILLIYTGFVYGLQRLCFGQLRPVEVEQLYDKGWIAVTETCLAMTLFKDDLGAFSMIMFTALLTGKVWAWIGDGRVEILEQQPPANPRLFHARLIGSLALSLLYNFTMCLYATRTVVRAAEFGMMVMFLFEFAILLVSSTQTSLRYVVSLYEQRVLKAQMQHGLETRRRHIREQRADILRRRESGQATDAEYEDPLPDENDVEEMDIEVPGWESKGHWILLLDLIADFVKLALYSVFFLVLAIFSGLPLHIMRDLFMTTRSFIKRLGALLRYRQAVKDLGRYPDATQEDLARENTCIICREEMRQWNPEDVSHVERTRPKKLPCGHILHFGCLKSWLERQQVCPTCRRSVVMNGVDADGNRNGAAQRPGGGFAPNRAGAGPAAPGAPDNRQGRPPRQGRANVRMFNFGPIRLGFAQGAPADFQDMAEMMGVPREDAAAALAGAPAQNAQPAAAQNAQPAAQQLQPAAAGALPNPAPPMSTVLIREQLRAVERNIQNETISLRLAENEAQTLRLLIEHIELIRMRQAQLLAAAYSPPVPPRNILVARNPGAGAQNRPQPAPAPAADSAASPTWNARQ
ncbi:E3 ubiquitin-protein ligase HRD1 [Magnaporthiopsis poae ATCC 64411]|uniref:RING-type E3 ubiquitin transferase n=1 Tax=Magnaporthiopsis poae (strain ATCC 64411 / 73-15) TaxID=644358 RepID=A0A0C4EBA1_MAGP6|nr:E3 ubiquitin-protein ligase HRD1 [Magnaporthiopsis poae ATCC 64411]